MLHRSVTVGFWELAVATATQQLRESCAHIPSTGVLMHAKVCVCMHAHTPRRVKGVCVRSGSEARGSSRDVSFGAAVGGAMLV